MEETKQPGIRFIAIHLLESTFKTFPLNASNRRALVTYEMAHKIEGVNLLIELVIKVNFPNMETDPFLLSARFLGLFVKNTEDSPIIFEKFAEINAPAIMFPFIREFVLNTTSRSPFPPLMIPPTNLRGIMVNKELTEEINKISETKKN